MVPPTPDRFHRELGRVVIDADTDPTVLVAVVDPVRNDLAQRFVGKVVDPHQLGLTLWAPLTATIMELTDQLLFLGIH